MIRIKPSDATFMLGNLALPDDLKNQLKMFRTQSGTISDESASLLRDLCTDLLDTQGFDEDYEPNDLGQKLEDLIDKLFIG